MNNVEFDERKLSIPILEICKKGIFLQLPVVIILFIIYYLFKGGYDILNNPWKVYFISLGIFILLFVLHEGVHYFLYLMCTNFDNKKISFGYDEEYLKPYCKCFSIIDINSFKLNKFLPIIIAGIIPYIISIFLGNFFLMIGSLCSIFACGVDVSLLIELNKHKEIIKIKDNNISYGFMRYEIESQKK